MAVQIKDDEIFELLERLAATEEMFKTPVSTIRDVAELTDASPNLIARILGEMRGPGEFETVIKRLDDHEARIKVSEAKLALPKENSAVSAHSQISQKSEEEPMPSRTVTSTYFDLLKRERDIPDYRVIEGIPPAIKTLFAIILFVALYAIVQYTGFRIERPPIPPTYEFKYDLSEDQKH
jgi:hypothetical protein